MGVQVVQHQAYHRYLGVGLIHQPPHPVGKVHRGAPLRHRHVPPSCQGLAGEEQVAGPLPSGTRISPPRTPWGCRQRSSDVAQKLGGSLVEADHWPFGVIGLGVEIQNVLHDGNILAAHLGSAPLLLPPRLEGVISGGGAPSRRTRIPPALTPPHRPPTPAVSSDHDLPRPGCRPR